MFPLIVMTVLVSCSPHSHSPLESYLLFGDIPHCRAFSEGLELADGWVVDRILPNTVVIVSDAGESLIPCMGQ
jgi:hypothetical protein